MKSNFIDFCFQLIFRFRNTSCTRNFFFTEILYSFRIFKNAKVFPVCFFLLVVNAIFHNLYPGELIQYPLLIINDDICTVYGFFNFIKVSTYLKRSMLNKECTFNWFHTIVYFAIFELLSFLLKFRTFTLFF